MSLRPIKGDCPVCGATSGKCREHLDKPDQILCMTLVDTRKGEVVSGYKCTGHTKCGTWAMFAFDNSQEWTQAQKDEWEREKAARRNKAKAEDDRRREHALSLGERDRQYRALLGELSLLPEDLAELQRRGFSDEEIADCGYKSVEKFQKLKGRYSKNLPGISQLGNTLACDRGILLPIRNGEGLIVGCQVRITGATDNKYRWLSGGSKGASPHVYGKDYSELPLSVFKPYKPEGIALCEGTGIKPFLASRRLNLAVIGAAGGQWCSSPNLFKTELDSLSSELGTTEVTIYPDGGDICNKGVMSRWQQVISLLESWGYSVRVAWWWQTTKLDCDIDELKPSEYQDIEYLQPSQFFNLGEQKNGFDWSSDWLKHRKFTPDTTINSPQFEFPAVPKKNAIVAVKSGLGTGKTKALIDLIKYSGRRAFILGYRNNLLSQTIARAQAEGVKIYHLLQDEVSYLAADESTNMALCLDSIHHLDGYFNDTDIYIDEACSVLLHAANGGTLKENQAKVLAILNKALQVSNRVFLLDGNLNDATVDFAAKLSGKPVVKIENTAKIPPHKFIFVDSVDADGELKKKDKSPLVKALLSDFVVPWIYSDSKLFTDILFKLFTDAGKRGYVLNSDTASEPWAKEFLDDPDDFIANKKPDFFIGSPTIESGVSVTIRHYFTEKFSFFCGVASTNQQTQALFRLRDNNIPHYVFCPQSSYVRDRSVPRTYSANLIGEILRDRTVQSALLATDNADDQLNIMLAALERSDKAWLSFTNRLQAIDNREQDNLRKCLIFALEEAGHSVKLVSSLLDEDTKEAIKDAREDVLQQHALEIFKAEPYPDVETANQIAKGNPRKEIQRRIEKTRLLDKLPEIEKSGAWNQDFIAEYHLKNRDFYRQQLNFYLLGNFDISRKRSEVNWYYQATKDHFFLGQFRDSHLKIWALQELNILQFTSGEYHKDSPEVVKLMERVRTDRQVALALNVAIPKETVDGREKINFINALLGAIGLNLKATGQVLIDGIKTRIYKLNEKLVNNQARLAVLKSIELKFDGYLTSEVVKKVEWKQDSAAIAPKATVDPITGESFGEPKEERGSGRVELPAEENLRYVVETIPHCENEGMLKAAIEIFSVGAVIKSLDYLGAEWGGWVRSWLGYWGLTSSPDMG